MGRKKKPPNIDINPYIETMNKVICQLKYKINLHLSKTNTTIDQGIKLFDNFINWLILELTIGIAQI